MKLITRIYYIGRRSNSTSNPPALFRREQAVTGHWQNNHDGLLSDLGRFIFFFRQCLLRSCTSRNCSWTFLQGLRKSCQLTRKYKFRILNFLECTPVGRSFNLLAVCHQVNSPSTMEIRCQFLILLEELLECFDVIQKSTKIGIAKIMCSAFLISVR